MAIVELTEAAARSRLERMLAFSCEPTLTAPEVDDLLLTAKRPDQYGVAPSSDSWTPTWELNAAAAEGWRAKAAKAVNDTDFAVDGGKYNRNAIFDHCEKMAEKYEARIVRRTGGPVDSDEIDIIGNL